MAKALYLLFDRTGEARYKDAADRYAIFTFTFPRDPIAPFDDHQRAIWRSRTSDRPLINNAASFQYGNALDPAYRQFRRHNPDEDCFDARADSLFDWLQTRRTHRGHAYNLGYAPQDPSIPDWAFTDDLRMVGTGLVGYYELTRRPDVLDSALRLSDYYLRSYRPGTPDGAFVETLGTWCIGPWPTIVSVEHFEGIQMDQAGWGFSARGAVEFLTRLHALLPADHPRAALMRDRCVRSVRWQFSCQFENGAVGMHAQDDEWLGMTAAALLAYDDVRQAGWVDGELASALVPKIEQATAWLLDNATEEMIDAGGYRKVTGRSTPWPAENSVWLLAWTVEGLLRLQKPLA